MCSREGLGIGYKDEKEGKDGDTNPTERSIQSITLDEDFQERLKRTVIDAKRKISKRDATPTIEIEGEMGCSLVVSDVVDDNLNEFVVIYRGNDTKHHTPMIRVPKDRFLYVYFGNLKECRVFLKSKLLRVMFDRCCDCQISIRSPIIGVVDFYKCTRSVISFRIGFNRSEEGSGAPIPLVAVEDCSELQLLQSVEEILFVIKMSVDVFGVIVDSISGQRLARYDLGKILWDSQEQNFVTLSKKSGFTSVASDFSLHHITHTVFMGAPVPSGGSELDMLGSTPPMRSFLR